MTKQATPSNIKQILSVIAKQCDDRDMAEFWAEEINHSCENADDMFGTEGQNDPRGDQRR